MDLDLSKHRVLITGASRGIGRAIAEGFAQEGCQIILVSRDGSQLEAAKTEIVQTCHVDVKTYVADLSQSGVASQLHLAFPDVDILVNNAGAIPMGDLLEIEEPAWRQAWDLKVFGFINLTREYYRAMRQRRKGVIINVIGFAAQKLDYNYIAGSSGNAGLVAFTQTLGSVSLDYGVRVVGVNPGWVQTEKAVASLRRRAAAEFDDEGRWHELVARDWPGRKLIQPHEIADLAVFLGSHRASSISGHVMAVDAGFAFRSYYRPSGAAADATR